MHSGDKFVVEAQNKIAGGDMNWLRSPYIVYCYVESNRKVKEHHLDSSPGKWAMEVEQML